MKQPRRQTIHMIGALLIAVLLQSEAWAQASDSAAASLPGGLSPEASAKLYAPKQEHEPYRRTQIIRDLAYGPASRNLLDVARPLPTNSRTRAGLRPVLIFIAGGAGHRIEVPGYMFYDNVLLWAVDNGFIGINVERDANTNWDTGARNIADVVTWTQAHIEQYGGDAGRIYLWGHSTGATMLSIYLAHQSDGGPGPQVIRGAILQSGAYNIAPLKATKPGRPTPQDNPDPAVRLSQSSLIGLKQTPVPLLLAATDGDPQDRPEYVTLLSNALCEARRCPDTLFFKGHDHMGEIFSIHTSDTAVSAPILRWLKSIESKH